MRCTGPSFIGYNQLRQPMVKRMTEPHKRPYQHPKYKIAYRVNNGREYEQSLRDRGDITLWISPETISAWRAPMTGKRGAQAH